MTLVHFEPQARFAKSDLLLMAEGLRALIAASQPDSWPSSVTDDVCGALRSLYVALGTSLPPAGDIGGLCERSSSRSRSSALQLLGLRLEAFALEGIQGRLLEAAMGVGSIEL